MATRNSGLCISALLFQPPHTLTHPSCCSSPRIQSPEQAVCLSPLGFQSADAKVIKVNSVTNSLQSATREFLCNKDFVTSFATRRKPLDRNETEGLDDTERYARYDSVPFYASNGLWVCLFYYFCTKAIGFLCVSQRNPTYGQRDNGLTYGTLAEQPRCKEAGKLPDTVLDLMVSG